MSTENVNKKKELNLAEPSEVRSLDFPLSLCQWEFSKPVVEGSSTNARAFIISTKVNGIVKANTSTLKNTYEYAHYY